MEGLHARYGDVFGFRLLGLGDVVMVADPDLVKDVFTEDASVLHAGEPARLLRPVVGPSSLLVLDEDEHIRERRLLLPSFHGERIAAYTELIAEIAREQIRRWPVDEPFALHPRMQAITLEAIIRIVLGADDEPTRRTLREALGRLMDTTGRSIAFQVPVLRRDLGPWRSWSRLQALVAEVDSLIYRQIAKRRADDHRAARTDILSLLLDARREDGTAMTDAELRDELVTILAAGHETTATALSWTFELLFRHPDDRARLTAEARAGNGHEYADAVVREALRLRPVIPLVARKTTRPWQLGPWSIPAGSIVAPSIYLMHRRPDVYTDPYAFRPGRFLSAAPGTYTWLPFGGGRRRCIGAAFAQLEMRVVLQESFRHLALRAAGAPQHFARRSITIAPSDGTPAVATPIHTPRALAT